MANSFTPGYTIPEVWSKLLQARIENNLVALEVCSMELRDQLTQGDRINRPYLSDIVAQTYTPGVAVTLQDITDNNEQLIVSEIRDASFYLDDVHVLQNNYNILQDRSKRVSYALMEEMDGAVLAEVDNADYTFDAGEVGGTAGQPITLTKSNVIDVFTTLRAYLANLGATDESSFIGVATPYVRAMFESGLFLEKGFNTADFVAKRGMQVTDINDSYMKRTVGKRGFVGNALGFGVYMSNNVLHEQTFTHSGNLSNGNTVTFSVPQLGTLTYTAKTTVSAQGDFKIGADIAATLTNLKDCITNVGGSATSNYSPYALNTAGSQKQLKIRLTASVASDVITFKTKGQIRKAATAGTFGTQAAIMFWGEEGSIDFVAQKMPGSTIRPVPDKHGVNVLSWDLYGTKYFKDGRDRSVKLKIAVAN